MKTMNRVLQTAKYNTLALINDEAPFGFKMPF